MGNSVSCKRLQAKASNTLEKSPYSSIIQFSGIHDCVPDESQPLNNFLIALHSYSLRSETELTVKQGDVLYLLEGSNEEWCYAKDQETGQIGYIPKILITRVKTLEAEQWVFIFS